MMRNRVDMEGNIMAAIIGSPTRYIQGKGEMKNLCSYADKFGKNLFILTSASGRCLSARLLLPQMHHAVHYLLSIQMKVFLKNICSCHQAQIWSW